MSVAATESEAAAGNAGQLVEPRRDPAVRRTKLAIESASMARLRTVLSMISFGFATYKSKAQGPKITDREPKNVGFALDGLGTLPLMAASVQSCGRVHDPQSPSASGGLADLVLLIGVLIAGAGVLVFTSIESQVALFRQVACV